MKAAAVRLIALLQRPWKKPDPVCPHEILTMDEDRIVCECGKVWEAKPPRRPE